MKKIIFLLSICLLLLVGCQSEAKPLGPSNADNITGESNGDTLETNMIAIIYFSATNNTERVAQVIAEVSGGELLEILPSVPYTSADLNYSNSNCRANLEQNDPSARPGIVGSFSLAEYDTIFLGYPIWWGKLPKIIYTFCDTYDLSDKIIIPFCTSGGSGISTSENELRTLEPNAIWLAGRRFSSSVSKSTINDWFIELNIEVK